MTNSELGWLAGYLEGEGCFTLGGKTPKRPRHVGSAVIVVSATDLDVVTKAAELMGGKFKQRAKPTVVGKPVWVAAVYARKAENLMRLLLPNMGLRRQAKINEILTVLQQRTGALKGSRKPTAKLTEQIVAEIKREKWPSYKGRVSELATKYNVRLSTISNIIHNRAWKHISATTLSP